MRDEEFYNIVGGQRISARQIDELTGMARGLCADGVLNQAEVEFLQKWLAVNASVSGHPVIGGLYRRVNDILGDGVADAEERSELLVTLNDFSDGTFELGEALKSTTLPICNPAPDLAFSNLRYCLTGTFGFGSRSKCEQVIRDRGGRCASLTQKTDVLVIGIYATESWKHSSYGNKILKACEMRDSGTPISIVGEQHWLRFL